MNEKRFKDIRQHKKKPEVEVSTETDRYGNVSVTVKSGDKEKTKHNVSDLKVDQAVKELTKELMRESMNKSQEILDMLESKKELKAMLTKLQELKKMSKNEKDFIALLSKEDEERGTFEAATQDIEKSSELLAMIKDGSILQER
jgi:hypothetical protein